MSNRRIKKGPPLIIKAGQINTLSRADLERLRQLLCRAWHTHHKTPRARDRLGPRDLERLQQAK